MKVYFGHLEASKIFWSYFVSYIHYFGCFYYYYYLVILKILEVCLSFYRSYSRSYSRGWFQWVPFFFPHHVSGFKSILVILKVLEEFWRFWEGKQIILEDLEEFCHLEILRGYLDHLKVLGVFWLFWKLKGYLVILKILGNCLRSTSRKSPQNLYLFTYEIIN